jgi:hypothetical protein
MRAYQGALFVTLAALFILAARAAMSDAGSTGESPWVLFDILNVRVSYQDISDNRIIYTDSPPPRITEFDMASGESRLLEEFHPCGVAQDVRIEGEWLVADRETI